MTQYFKNPDNCVDYIQMSLGKHWVTGAPLGLGKPNHLLNCLYQRAKSQPDINLDLFTALSLDPPYAGSGLKKRFMQPFLQRQFGDYPRLAYIADIKAGKIPDNIRISEFYFRSGSRLKNTFSQRHYVSSNYTHVARDMLDRGVNLIVQLVAVHPERPGYYSLSCNPDVTLDLLKPMDSNQTVVVAQVSHDLPYMEGDAELPASAFDAVLEECDQRLFAVPRMSVSDQDYMIGLYASSLVADGGTLQLGIGSLGDAVCYFTSLREQNNANYRDLLSDANQNEAVSQDLMDNWGGSRPFQQGLYAASEMFMDGFLHLYQSGVLRRRVYDDPAIQNLINQGELSHRLEGDTLEVLWDQQILPRHLSHDDLQHMTELGIFKPGLQLTEGLLYMDETPIENDLEDEHNRQQLARLALGQELKHGVLLHAAFFLGSQWMYDTLNKMSRQERDQFQMTAVSRINQLYRGEDIDRAQRLEARFINTTMKMTLLGAAVSDQLDQGQVVSGVGGQYNFVAMAHALDRGRSILMLRSYRQSSRGVESNMLWQYTHTTIPRHLRDIVVTEYGVADLRGKADEEVIQSLLCISDSRWQEDLRQQAVSAGKLAADWVIPSAYQDNSPQRIRTLLQPWKDKGVIRDFPFGSDFTDEEIALGRALKWLDAQNRSLVSRIKLLMGACFNPGVTKPFGHHGKMAEQYWDLLLQRMELKAAKGFKQSIQKRLLCYALKKTLSKTPL